MPKYVIERDIPNVGDVTADQFICDFAEVMQRA